jgi:hypothetical protein
MRYFYHNPRINIGRKFTERLMNSWDSTLRKYEKTWGNEGYLPYVYGERANIGILSVAAARIKAFPFEEFSTVKRRGHRKGAGRADLQIITENNQEWHIEAKRIQRSFRKGDFIDVVRSKLDEASKEVRDLYEASELRMGIVFVIPFSITDTHKGCGQFVKKMSNLKSLKADFCAIHLAKHELYQKHHPFAPGIAIVGRYVFIR